jgi:hypothetical protein
VTGLTQTRGVVRDIAEHAPTALNRHRALLLDQQLTGSTIALGPGMLRQIVIAVRHLVGPAWLSAHASEDAIMAFSHLETTTVPPPLPILDHTLARCLEARFRSAAAKPAEATATPA